MRARNRIEKRNGIAIKERGQRGEMGTWGPGPDPSKALQLMSDNLRRQSQKLEEKSTQKPR